MRTREESVGANFSVNTHCGMFMFSVQQIGGILLVAQLIHKHKHCTILYANCTCAIVHLVLNSYTSEMLSQ